MNTNKNFKNPTRELLTTIRPNFQLGIFLSLYLLFFFNQFFCYRSVPRSKVIGIDLLTSLPRSKVIGIDLLTSVPRSKIIGIDLLTSVPRSKVIDLLTLVPRSEVIDIDLLTSVLRSKVIGHAIHLVQSSLWE